MSVQKVAVGNVRQSGVEADEHLGGDIAVGKLHVTAGRVSLRYQAAGRFALGLDAIFAASRGRFSWQTGDFKPRKWKK